MRSSTTAFLAVIALALHATAAYDFIECADPTIATNLLTGLVNAAINLLSPANSVTGCPTFCGSTQGGSTTYSLYQPGLFGLLGTCYCTNQQPTAAFTVPGSDSAGTCPSATYQVNHLGPVADKLVFSGCTTGSLPGVASPSPFTTPNADNCFNTCQTFKYLIMTPDATGNSFTCQCASFLTTGSSATCNRNVQNIYNNAAIAPSGRAARKRRDVAIEELRRKNNTPCPRGYEACIIPDSEYAYECLDTSTELEACGGCVYGYWDDQLQRNATGVDCSVTTGVALGGSTCRGGQCHITRCLDGYDLNNGNCVRKFNSNNNERRRR